MATTRTKLTRADREWIRKQLRATETRIIEALDEAIRSEAQLAVLQSMRSSDAPPPA